METDHQHYHMQCVSYNCKATCRPSKQNLNYQDYIRTQSRPQTTTKKGWSGIIAILELFSRLYSGGGQLSPVVCQRCNRTPHAQSAAKKTVQHTSVVGPSLVETMSTREDEIKTAAVRAARRLGYTLASFRFSFRVGPKVSSVFRRACEVLSATHAVCRC